jgi:hypothetical protein
MAYIRKKAGEQLSEQSIERVISLLEQEKPITKKSACEILNISYNTTRLNKIITEYKSTVSRRVELRKKFRNKPLEKDDIKLIISSYLDGISLADIADNIFRSIALIKRTLIKYRIPLRDSNITYWNPVEVPVEAMMDDYSKGDLVYSARYNQASEIIKEYKKGMYRIWLYKDMQFAYQPYYELSDLREVQKDIGITIEGYQADEINNLIYTALNNAKKAKK